MKSLLQCRKSLNVILPFTGKLLHNVNMFEMCAKKPHSQSILIKNAIKYSIYHHKSYFIHFNNSLYSKPNIKCSIILLLYLNILFLLYSGLTCRLAVKWLPKKLSCLKNMDQTHLICLTCFIKQIYIFFNILLQWAARESSPLQLAVKIYSIQHL